MDSVCLYVPDFGSRQRTVLDFESRGKMTCESEARARSEDVQDQDELEAFMTQADRMLTNRYPKGSSHAWSRLSPAPPPA